MRIAQLLDAPHAAATLERWFIEEWAPWYGPGGQGDAAVDLAACDSLVELPLCLVALGTDGTPLGTVGLRSESVGDELGVGPWLAALLVAKDQRRQGIATRLVEALENLARALGFEAIYCSTDQAEAILERRGWVIYGSSDSLRGPVSVYRRELGS